MSLRNANRFAIEVLSYGSEYLLSKRESPKRCLIHPSSAGAEKTNSAS